jgi:hypothetical protein
VEDDLRVRGRLEDRAAPLQPVLQGDRVGEVAVVGDRETAAGELGEQRLDVALDRSAMGRITDVADGAVALEGVHHRRRGKAVADQAEVPGAVELASVEADNAGAFLAAVLQGMQAKHGQGRCVGVAEHTEHPALFAELVIIERVHRRFQIHP